MHMEIYNKIPLKLHMNTTVELKNTSSHCEITDGRVTWTTCTFPQLNTDNVKLPDTPLNGASTAWKQLQKKVKVWSFYFGRR